MQNQKCQKVSTFCTESYLSRKLMPNRLLRFSRQLSRRPIHDLRILQRPFSAGIVRHLVSLLLLAVCFDWRATSSSYFILALLTGPPKEEECKTGDEREADDATYDTAGYGACVRGRGIVAGDCTVG